MSTVSLGPHSSLPTPSQQRKVTRSAEKVRKEEDKYGAGKYGGHSSIVEGLLAGKRKMWERKAELSERRLALAEKKADREHKIRMKEMESRKLKRKQEQKKPEHPK